MKLFLSLLMLWSLSYAEDSTIEVIKRVDSLPSIAVEDSSISYDDTFKMRFFKSIIADLNVISIFNVDRHYRDTHFNDTNVIVDNKDMNYVLRYKMFEDDNGALNVGIKLLKENETILSKNYKVGRQNIYMLSLMLLLMI